MWSPPWLWICSSQLSLGGSSLITSLSWTTQSPPPWIIVWFCFFFLLSFLHNYHSFSPKRFSNCPLLLLEYSDKLDFFQFVFFKKSPFWLLQSSLVFCLMHTCCSGLFLCHHHLCLPPGLDPLLPKVHTLLFPGSLPCFIGVHPPQTFLELVHGNFLKFFEILYVWKCLYPT